MPLSCDCAGNEIHEQVVTMSGKYRGLKDLVHVFKFPE